jgi:hypothetical protein
MGLFLRYRLEHGDRALNSGVPSPFLQATCHRAALSALKTQAQSREETNFHPIAVALSYDDVTDHRRRLRRMGVTGIGVATYPPLEC